MRDDKVVYVATQLWPGSYTATYVARATTPGVFARPPAHAEEMYNPAVFGESDGGVFTVTAKAKCVRAARGLGIRRSLARLGDPRSLGMTVLSALVALASGSPARSRRTCSTPPRPASSSLDRAGLPLRSTRAADGSLRRWVPLAEMDPDLLAAFLAVEDRRFYRAPGRRSARPGARGAGGPAGAADRRPAARPSRCSSRACCARPPRTWPGKASQALWALRLERQLSKQAILEQYLNRVPLGQGAIGVEAGGRALLRRPRHRAEPGPGRAARRARAGAVGATIRWSRRAGPARAAPPRSRGW